MELQILHAIQEIHQGWLTDVMRLFTTIGESGLVWIAIAIVLTCIPKTRKCGLTMMIAMAITYLVGNLFLKNVIARPRPCAVDNSVILKIPFPSEYSFPSGHSSNGFAGAVTIFCYYRRAALKSAHGGTYCIFQTLLLRSLPDGYPGRNLIGNAGCAVGGLACETLGEPCRCAVCIERR